MHPALQLIHACMARSKNTRAKVTNAYEHAVDKVGNRNYT